MDALHEIRIASALDAPLDAPFTAPISSIPDGVLVLRAPALDARQIDPRSVRRRPPRAVVIEVRHRADLRGVERFLADAGIVGTVPTLLAAPVELASELDDVEADDLLLLPYTGAEIAARVRRIERRWQTRSTGAIDTWIEVGALRVDTAAHRVQVDGRAISLTRLEYALLVFLVQHPGRVFTREQLLARVWGNDGLAGGRTVDIHVRRLRAKLAHGVATLETVRGVGYRFMPSSAQCLSPSSPVGIADSAWRPAAS